MHRIVLSVACVVLLPAGAVAQATGAPVYTHADTLRGSNGPARAWWDVTFYDLHVKVSPADSSISGRTGIGYRVLHPSQLMQVDLQQPMLVDSMVQDGRALQYRRDGNAFFVTLVAPQAPGATHTVTVYFHGKPRAAVRPPWDGGYIWHRDSLGNLWIATANEGLGASAWWPNKDYLADEPDSQRIAVTVPDPMIDVSNGRLRDVRRHADGTTTYEWFVNNPINNYDVSVNAGDYTHFSDIYRGEDGALTLDFWPLSYHREVAERQWAQAVPMLKCFEHWFGPYPWYRDGYKLIEAPHLGMEHQSGVAYGNHFMNGYLGRDLSGTGLGLKWDYIVVHESAHEWWGNSLTMQDQADMWVHESFADYAEALYEECQAGKAAGAEYVIGLRKNIRNDRPIIPAYGVNAEGSGDMYYKGANMLHTIRQVVNDDEKWRGILRGLQATFRHQTVTGAQVEEYISQQAGLDLSKVFDQYLRTTMVPELDYRFSGTTLFYRWEHVVPGFAMPVRVTLAPDEYHFITPTAQWQSVPTTFTSPAGFRVDANFYVTARPVPLGGGSKH
ncbi:MAG TPA: M1 family metallopeptidase [Gemmatimonadaceae bacterium]|jgi:aminopeptidase N|nr:M1 family metallopeptidase [Gemmatimonadaceae bacterium]